MQVKPTEASYTLRDPQEVLTFLTKLVEWGRTEENAWHQEESCIGWALDTAPVMSETQNGGHAEAAQANGNGAHWQLSLQKLRAWAPMSNHQLSAFWLQQAADSLGRTRQGKDMSQVSDALSPHAGDADGKSESPTVRDMAESKLYAFGLPVPRSMLMRQHSGGGGQRGGRPPLAPTSPEPPSSATSSSRSLNVIPGGWSTQTEPCTSGYNTPVQVTAVCCAAQGPC